MCNKSWNTFYWYCYGGEVMGWFSDALGIFWQQLHIDNIMLTTTVPLYLTCIQTIKNIKKLSRNVEIPGREVFFSTYIIDDAILTISLSPFCGDSRKQVTIHYRWHSVRSHPNLSFFKCIKMYDLYKNNQCHVCYDGEKINVMQKNGCLFFLQQF